MKTDNIRLNLKIKKIMQEVLIYLILSSAVFYLGYRGYLAFRKKSAKTCASCPANENA